jgi:tetratricopeptide (TPR) repeat protein
MKKLSTTLALAFAVIFAAFCADPAYENAMKKQLAAMKSIQTLEESQAVTNAFLRIADAKTDEWLPLYYAAYLQTTAVFRFEVNKDQYLDQAMSLVEKAEKISGENSEVTAIKGYVVMGKISLDPASRGQSMSPQAMQLFGKAISLDRENPRALMLMAQMEQGMARFFGQGPEKACGLAKNALALYTKEEAKTGEDYLLPTWGRAQAQQVADACN